MTKVNRQRVRELNTKAVGDGPVVYWMQREERAHDNWALLYAQEKAIEHKVSLIVVFNMFRIPARAYARHYDFLVTGLEEVAEELSKKDISFCVLEGDGVENIPAFAAKEKAGLLVTDFNPMKGIRNQKEQVVDKIDIAFHEVDAHNIIPCWLASDKEEYAAYTFRPKVHRRLKEYLEDFPNLKTHPHKASLQGSYKTTVKEAARKLDIAPIPELPSWITPGYKAAQRRLRSFVDEGFNKYAEDRNDPNKDALSNMSPYLHYGHICAQTIALEVEKKRGVNREDKEVYLEELIVRKELADNFCYYNENYNKVSGAHAWAQKTIEEHKKDEREYIYTKKELEEAKTHDELWNATQLQMVREGKMHGWCRMYWAKKILEWTNTHQEAIDIALYLNDKYELDGYDPNGVVGVMWSICGVHDRAWNERPIFGKIRYMNYAGAKRKFDVKAYVEKYSHEEILFS